MEVQLHPSMDREGVSPLSIPHYALQEGKEEEVGLLHEERVLH
jgi:hypothetical protein